MFTKSTVEGPEEMLTGNDRGDVDDDVWCHSSVDSGAA